MGSTDTTVRRLWQRPRDLQHVLVRDGTDRAELLRQNQVRLESSEQIHIQFVDRQSLAHPFSHQPVDFPTVGDVGREDVSCDGRLVARGGRVVTFMRDGDELLV